MMTRAYYNEFDAYPAQWLRNLAAAGHITAGTVDGRSITEVTADDLQGHTRAHFFAGLGGWDHALKLAGWPTELPVWTGSCPCQPFSGAGQGGGFNDERHIWPVWFELIAECRPVVIFGEQVVSPAGRVWWDAVSSDLEGLGYSTRAFDLCAAGVGAPHIRQRLYWVAYSESVRRLRHGVGGGGRTRGGPKVMGQRPEHSRHSGRVAYADSGHTQQPEGDGAGPGEAQGGRPSGRHTGRGASVGMGDADSRATGQHAGELHGDEGQHEERQADGRHTPQPTNGAHRLGGADGKGPQGRSRRRNSADQRPTWPAGMVDSRGAGSLAGQWADPDWLYCRDGRRRPVEPGTQPLAYGLPGRVGQLRAYGNAIVPQAAAALIRATMEAIQ